MQLTLGLDVEKVFIKHIQYISVHYNFNNVLTHFNNVLQGKEIIILKWTKMAYNLYLKVI